MTGPPCLCSDPEDGHAVNTEGATRYRARCTRPGCGCTLYRPASARPTTHFDALRAERDEYARALREIAGAARAAYPTPQEALRAVVQRAEEALGGGDG